MKFKNLLFFFVFSYLSLAFSQQKENLQKKLNYTSGVKFLCNCYNIEYLRIRGLNRWGNSYRDDLKNETDYFEETYGLEKVDIIKGPLLGLYGKPLLMGGDLNIQSKKPTLNNFANIYLASGFWNFFEKAVDFGLVNQREGLSFRLVALYSYKDSFVEHIQKKRIYLAPSLTWKLAKNTRLTFLIKYMNDNYITEPGLPDYKVVKTNLYGNIFIGDYFSRKALSNRIKNNKQIGYQFYHAFSKNIVFKQNFRYTRLDKRLDDILNSLALVKKNKNFLPYSYSEYVFNNIYNTNTFIDFSFSGLGGQYNLTTGVEFIWKQVSKHKELKPTEPTIVFNSLDPNQKKKYILYYPPKINQEDPNIKQDLSAYIQKSAQFGNLRLKLAGRYDMFWSYRKKTAPKRDLTLDLASFSPKLSFNYELIKNFAVYGSYAQSFKNQADKKDQNQNFIQPGHSINKEIGFITKLFNNKLISSFTIYHLTNINLAVKNKYPIDTYYIKIDKEDLKGIEADISLNPFPGGIAKIAYTFNNIKDHSIRKNPKHIIAVSLKYTIQSGLLHNLGFGFSGKYLTKQYLANTSKLHLPSYALLDTSLFYKYSNLKSQINIYNLTSKKHYYDLNKISSLNSVKLLNIKVSITASF